MLYRGVPTQIIGIVRSALVNANERPNDLILEATTCRQCGERVRMFARFCPGCDQSDPGRLSLRSSLMILGIPSVFVAIFCLLTAF